MLAHEQIKKICAGIKKLRELCGKPKAEHTEPEDSPWDPSWSTARRRHPQRPADQGQARALRGHLGLQDRAII